MKFRDFVNGLLKFTNYRLIKVRKVLNSRYECALPLKLEMLLSYQLQKTDNFFFVQIGANDGSRADDISEFVRENDLNGIVIEPLSDMYDALIKIYSDCKGVVAVNAAIGKVDGTMTLYRVDPTFKEAPDWCHGIASFDKKHVMSASKKVPNIGEHILEEEVNCLSFASLVEQYGIEKIDLLQIDAEGYDYEIIKSIDFTSLQPAIVRYEDAGLSTNDSAECMRLFMDMGYRIFATRNDVTAVRL